MRFGGIRPVRTCKHKVTTNSNHSLGIAPNCKWASDISYVLTLEGWLYLAVILDLSFGCPQGRALSISCSAVS